MLLLESHEGRRQLHDRAGGALATACHLGILANRFLFVFFFCLGGGGCTFILKKQVKVHMLFWGALYS